MQKQNLAPFIVIVIPMMIIGVVLVNWYNYRLKKRLLDAHPPDEYLYRLVRQLWRPAHEALKWGLLFFSGGLGLIVLHLIPDSDSSLELGVGIESVFLALGFLTYYFLTKKDA